MECRFVVYGVTMGYAAISALELPSSAVVEKPWRRAGVIHHLIQEQPCLEVDPGARWMGEVVV